MFVDTFSSDAGELLGPSAEGKEVVVVSWLLIGEVVVSWLTTGRTELSRRFDLGVLDLPCALNPERMRSKYV